MDCSLCHRLGRPTTGQTHSSLTLPQLQVAAATCPDCELLRSIVETADLESIDTIALCLNEAQHHSLNINCQTKSRRPQIVEIHFLPVADLTPSLLGEAKLNRARSFQTSHPPYTGSDESFQWAASKIKTCSEEHQHCPEIQPAPLPDRVLSLGRDDADVRLREAAGQSDVYATLSHCWGGYMPAMLTRANLSDFRQKVPCDSLPKTFRDAMSFARRLGIHYLWIDSLCIVQDDTKDWNQQSAKMAQIYEQSAITLAATVAADGRDGLFTPHRLSLAGYVTDGVDRIDITQETTMDGLLLDCQGLGPRRFLVKERLLAPHPDYFFRVDNAAKAALLGRGWAYQERLLSRRVLHFGHSDLLWECNLNVACQCGTWRHSLSRHKHADFPKRSHTTTLRGSDGSADSSSGSYMWGLRYRWQRIVAEFSALDLTFESDKLPAVAGVSRQFSSRLASLRYVLGVWEDFLPELLLWTMTRLGDEKLLMALPNVAPSKAIDIPSWTWASASGPVRYPMEDPTMNSPAIATGTIRDFKVVQIPWSNVESDRLLGHVKGNLVLLGHLTKTRLRKYVAMSLSEPYNCGVCRFDGTEFYSVTLDFPLASSGSRWIPVNPLWPEPPPGFETVNPWETYRGKEDTKDPTVVPILDYEASQLRRIRDGFQSCEELDESVWCLFVKFWDGPGGASYFLVLRRVAQSPDRFARIGLLSYSPTRLPIFDPQDTTLREVILV